MSTPTFTVGTTYTCRSAVDSDFVMAWTVTGRSAKFITVVDGSGRSKRVGVKRDAQGEWALPDGTYSMAPVIRADRPAVPV